MRRLRVILLSGLAVTFFAGVAQAGLSPEAQLAKDQRLCDKGIQKEALKFKGAFAKKLGKCTDFARNELFKEANNKTVDFPKVAEKCEKQLAGVLDFGNVKAGKDSLTKFQAGIDKLAVTKLNCTEEVLSTLGHLIGDVNAPPVGGNAEDWVKIKLKTWKVFSTVTWLTKASPLALDRFDDMVVRGGQEVSASNKPNVDCTSPPTHPNLCTLARDNPNLINQFDMSTSSVTNICHLHECELIADPLNIATGSNFSVKVAAPGTQNFQFPGFDVLDGELAGSTIYKICKVAPVPRLGADLGGDLRLMATARTRTIKAAILAGVGAVCIEGIAGEGWCDCEAAGSGLPVDYVQCSDHVTVNGVSDCPDASAPTAVDTEETCFCTESAADCGSLQEPRCTPILSAPCSDNEPLTCTVGYCGAQGGGGRCHPGTVQSADIDLTGSSGLGDCFINTQTSLTVTPVFDQGVGSGICLAGPNLGQLCDVLLGGFDCGAPACVPFAGPDTVPCTMDDLLPRGDPASIPLTTGTANAILNDAMYVAGRCSSDATIPCIEAANCPGADTCDGAVLATVVNNPVSGAPLANCEQLETSDLGGWAYASSFVFADGTGLGDGGSRNFFICE